MTSRKEISRLAKLIVYHSIRNGPIEDIHSDEFGGSRISQEEMKEITKYAVTNVAYLLNLYQKENRMLDEFIDVAPSDWDEPDWDYIECKIKEL